MGHLKKNLNNYIFESFLIEKLDLKNPKTFNEKLQWLKLYDRKDIYTTMVDKYEAKKYVSEKIGEEYGVKHLPSDFKKREGYKRSIELSKELDLYRQDYCGCEFSKRG